MEIQTVHNYADYIKCGEILKSPLQSFPTSIVLKCLQCTDVHHLLETFVNHIQDHFKEILTLNELDGKAGYENVHGDEMESEGIGLDNVSVKLEEVVSTKTSANHKYKHKQTNKQIYMQIYWRIQRLIASNQGI